MKGLEYELEVLSKLISFNTDAVTKKEYGQCAEYLKHECEKLGFDTRIVDPKEITNDGISRPSVIAKLDIGAKKTVALAMHFDVVPPGVGWTKDPFKLTIEGNVAYGRGVVDDKGNIATALGALREVRDKLNYNVVLFLTPEEEVGGKLGMGYAVQNFEEKIDEVLVLDAGNEYISIGASGVVFGEIKVYGEQGHAGYPFKYRNAVHDLLRLGYHLLNFADYRALKISKLRAPAGGPIENNYGRFSITIVRGGEKENIIPGEAYLRFDMRLIPEENSELAVQELKSYLTTLSNKLGIKAELTTLEGLGSNYYSEPNSDAVRKFKNIAEKIMGKELEVVTEFGGNDGRFFSKYDAPIISFGLAKEGTRYHGPDEFLELEDMRKLKKILIEYLSS